jgi:hypothetical protein
LSGSRLYRELLQSILVLDPDIRLHKVERIQTFNCKNPRPLLLFPAKHTIREHRMWE